MNLIPSKYSILFAMTVIGFLAYGAIIQAAIMSVFVAICWSDNN